MQPQPHPHGSLLALVASDNGEGGRIVKGVKVEVAIAVPFRDRGKECGSWASGISVSRHRQPSL
jgi:hypothetical protein